MATIVLQVPDESLATKVKQACKMLVGVASVKLQRQACSQKHDITTTAGYQEAMDDVQYGRITHHNSVDDMFKNIIGEDAFKNIRSSHV